MSHIMSDKRPPIIIDMTPEGEFRDQPPPPAPRGFEGWLSRLGNAAMLLALSGRKHRVVTGVCLWHRPGREPVFADCESLLAMEPLTDEFLDWYLASGLWEGKAGACGYQDERLPLRLVAGSESNVVGLPLELVRQMLGSLESGVHAE